MKTSTVKRTVTFDGSKDDEESLKCDNRLITAYSDLSSEEDECEEDKNECESEGSIEDER